MEGRATKKKNEIKQEMMGNTKTRSQEDNARKKEIQGLCMIKKEKTIRTNWIKVKVDNITCLQNAQKE